MPTARQYFEVLGLEAPPADRKAVKRAYSKMLKVTRPEDDPEGFMRLRDAHDQALDILRWRAEDAARQIENSHVESDITATPQPKDTPPEPTDEALAESGLTYSDMLPEPDPKADAEPESETSYAIGPTPNFDAPVTLFEPPTPPAEPLIEDLNAILANPKHYNNREKWNLLFRKARQLDIDDYVDFEQLLMDTVLRFHGYFDDHPHHGTPEKMPQKFSPSITASLFKTMSWDQVSKMGYIRGIQIEWLARRMKLRKRGVDPVPLPITNTNSSNTKNVWLFLLGFFILVKVIQALANA